jgi:hypothetical protein
MRHFGVREVAGLVPPATSLLVLAPPALPILSIDQ